MSHHLNLVRIKGVYHALGDLKDSVAFVGGATVSLYADKPEQSDVRPTNDLDILVEIASYSDYAKLQDKLYALNFKLDSESPITCRYKFEGLTVDIMPTNEGILGFTNRWYQTGFANLVQFRIDATTKVNIFPATYFISSKLEAFKGRGNNDGRTSQDFEDIVFVLDNRKQIWDDLKNASQELKNYLSVELSALSSNPYLGEWISCHLEFETSAARARFIIGKINEFLDS